MSAEARREQIEDGDCLLRRVPDQPEKMWTRKSGLLRPSSAALKPSQADGGLSVDVRRLLPDPTDPASVLADDAVDGLIEFHASEPRAAGLDVVHTPSPDRYAHADVVGFDQLQPAAHKRFRRELAKQAVWVKEPTSAVA